MMIIFYRILEFAQQKERETISKIKDEKKCSLEHTIRLMIVGHCKKLLFIKKKEVYLFKEIYLKTINRWTRKRKSMKYNERK